MFILYNLFQLLFGILFFPLILILILSSKKLRNRIPPRLGLGLNKHCLKNISKTGSTFWIHALSVGEVTSALPLIKGIKKHYPESHIVLSVTTTTGKKIDQFSSAGYCSSIREGCVILLGQADGQQELLYKLFLQ